MLSFSSPLSVTSHLLNFLNNHTGAMAMRPPTLNKIGTTSMHSSRMRTALFGGRHYMSVPGGLFPEEVSIKLDLCLGGICLGDLCPGGSPSRVETPSGCEQNHRQVQKHYLPATSLAGGKNYLFGLLYPWHKVSGLQLDLVQGLFIKPPRLSWEFMLFQSFYSRQNHPILWNPHSHKEHLFSSLWFI